MAFVEFTETSKPVQRVKEVIQGSASMKVDLVVKFGGSAITNKSQLETLNPAALESAAKLIADCFTKQLTCIVVHGAGSFGHHQAKQFQVNKGWNHLDNKQDIERVKTGFCLTRQSVTKLHHYVVEALVQQGVPAVGLSFFSVWTNDNKVLRQYDLEGVQKVLQAGMVPVLHGDGLFDDNLGCSILSGDTIIKTISKHLSVSRVVFLTDVAGVYDKPPDKTADARLQTQLYVKDGHIATPRTREGVVSDSKENDVTGGMTLKLQTAVDIVSCSHGNTAVYVCRLGSEYGNQICLNGQAEGVEEQGTRIQAMP